MGVGDLPGSLSCPGPFGRAIVWQPCFEPLKLDTSRAAPEEMGVDGQMHDFIICSRMRVSRGFLQVTVQYSYTRKKYVSSIFGDMVSFCYIWCCFVSTPCEDPPFFFWIYFMTHLICASPSTAGHENTPPYNCMCPAVFVSLVTWRQSSSIWKFLDILVSM
jgi:hypothetical protein